MTKQLVKPCEFVGGACINCAATEQNDCEGWVCPPQRQWVGLTDEEIETTLLQLWCDINIMKFMICDRPQQETVVFILSRAIEAKLKELNK